MSKMNVEDDVETNEKLNDTSNLHISDIIGNWGPIQKRVFFILTIIYIANPIQNLSLVLYTPKIDFWCNDPPVEINNITKNICTIGDVECKSFTYDDSFYRRTFTSELDLVCNKAWYGSLGQSFHQLGYAISGVAFGFVSDNWGRIFSIKIAMIMEIIAGFVQAFTPSTTVWLINRIFLGASIYGRFLNGYVLIIEWVGPKVRAPAGILHECGYSIGYFLLPIMYYFLADYRIIQASLTSLQVVSLIVVYFFLPESPRWQLTHNQYEKARKQLVKALEAKKVTFDENKINDKVTKIHNDLKGQIEKEKTMKVPTVIDVMKSPKLLKVSLILYFIWFSQSFNSYGSFFNIGNIGGNVFINTLVFAFSHLLSNLFCYFCLKKIGRKKLLVSFFLVESISFAVIVACSWSESLVPFRIIAAFCGAFTGNSAFNLIYLYTGETFPTVMRQQSIGTCSLFARMGSIIAPFVRELVQATHLSIGMGLFAVLAGIGAFLCIFLPETRGKEIPETVGQAMTNIESDETVNLK